jgi:phage major head subunit gpT-like protein
MIVTQANLQLFFTGYETRFWQQYALAERVAEKIATTFPVATEAWLSGFENMLQKYREWIGSRVVQTPTLLTYQVPIKNWENTQAIDKFRFEDDTYGLYDPTIPFMAMLAKKLTDYNLRDMILNQGSFTGSFQNCLDGLSFFNTAHPVNYWDPSQGTYPNDYTSGGVSVNNQLIGGGLSMTSFATVFLDAARRKNESGEAGGYTPDTAMSGPVLKLALDTLLQAQFLGVPQIVQLGSGTGANAPMVGSTSNQMRAWADSFMWEDLSSGTAIGTGSNTYDQVWYLLKLKAAAVKPFAHLLRKMPDFTYRIRPEDPVVFDKHQYVYGSEARESVAWGFPQTASRSGP